jgi:hypothetical protein
MTNRRPGSLTPAGDLGLAGAEIFGRLPDDHPTKEGGAQGNASGTPRRLRDRDLPRTMRP